MLVVNKLGFFIDYSYFLQIESFFKDYGIQIISPEKGIRTSDIRYEIPVSFKPYENMEQRIEVITSKLLSSFPIDHVGEAIRFSYSDDHIHFL